MLTYKYPVYWETLHVNLPSLGPTSPVRMSDAIYDPHAYTRLTDHVVQQILMTTSPELEEVCMTNGLTIWTAFFVVRVHLLRPLLVALLFVLPRPHPDFGPHELAIVMT